jgi:type 1 fimbria pilin
MKLKTLFLSILLLLTFASPSWATTWYAGANVTVTNNSTYTPSAPSWPITVTQIGASGGSINKSGTIQLANNNSMTITAIKNNGWNLVWTSTGSASCTGSGLTCTVTNPGAAGTITATFTEIPILPWH